MPFAHVAEECRAVRDRVAVLDLTSFAKIEVSGTGAEAFLNRTFANKMPRRAGGIALCHILTDSGVTEAEITVTRITDDSFFLLSAGAMQARDLDLLQKALRNHEAVTITDVRADYGCLAVTGPRARELLSRVTEADLSSAAFPWMTAREIEVCGIPTRALRVSYAGELGWELYLPVDRMAQAYDAIMSAGGDLGVRDFGMYALNSLRMEKAYRGFGWELSNELTLLEADMERFIGFDKDDFIGKAALLKRKQEGMRWKLAYMAVDADHLDVMGSEAVYMNDRIVGVVTSGGYGHATRLNLAFAYVEPDLARPGTKLEIEMLGHRYGCKVLPTPVYDPKNERLRS
jgi:dimethylglycine dehydrogenase